MPCQEEFALSESGKALYLENPLDLPSLDHHMASAIAITTTTAITQTDQSAFEFAEPLFAGCAVVDCELIVVLLDSC